MANPLQGADIVGHSLRFSELGLTNRDLPATTAIDLTVYTSPVPETVFVVVQLASGTVTAAIQATANGTFTSADMTTGAVTVTYPIAVFANTSSTNNQINVRLTPGGSGCRIASIVVLPLARLTAGEDWFNVRDGVQAVAGNYNAPTSDGSGTFVIDYTV